MYIVEHIPTGKYFKRFQFQDRAMRYMLVERKKARVFSSMSGVKNCLGNAVWLKPPIMKGGRKQFSRRVLDETVWKVHTLDI